MYAHTVCLSVHTYIYMDVYVHMHEVYVYVYDIYTHIWTYYLSVCLPACPSVCLSVCLSACLPTFSNIVSARTQFKHTFRVSQLRLAPWASSVGCGRAPFASRHEHTEYTQTENFRSPRQTARAGRRRSTMAGLLRRTRHPFPAAISPCRNLNPSLAPAD